MGAPLLANRTGRFVLLAACLVLLGFRPAGLPEERTRSAVLSLRVIDAQTGKASSCRVLVLDPGGESLVNDPSLGKGIRCDGSFKKELPAGKLTLRITRGFETSGVTREVILKEGETTSVEVKLARVIDLRAKGWYSGDSHAHMIHGERDITVSFEDVALAARAEDLQYLSLAQTWNIRDQRPEALQAAVAKVSVPTSQLAWNLEAPKNYYKGDATRCLGHCWNLGLSGRTPEGADVVSVLLEASAYDYETTKPSYANFESHRLIHDQGGAVFYTHPTRWWFGAWGGQAGYPKQENARVSNMAVELPLDVLVGPTFDGIDLITTNGEYEGDQESFSLWAMLLNHGYRLAATASSDACFDRPGGAYPGRARTYTYLPDGFSMQAVTRATAAGHTLATTGPLLLATLDGQPPGSEFPADGRPVQLHIESWASGEDPGKLSRLELLRNGDVLKTWAPNDRSFRATYEITEKENAWYCMRAFGSAREQQRAITGAFYFAASRVAPPPASFTADVTVIDAATGEPLTAEVQEVRYAGTIPRPGAVCRIERQARITVPGTVRLRAAAPGYRPETLSPFLDNPSLVELITTLDDASLLRWETFERIRALMSDVKLTFRLKRGK